MKVLKEGLPKDGWRIVRDKVATHCIHGRSLSLDRCADCTLELMYDGDDDRPWRIDQAGADGVYCSHGVSLDSFCQECRSEGSEEGT